MALDRLPLALLLVCLLTAAAGCAAPGNPTISEAIEATREFSLLPPFLFTQRITEQRDVPASDRRRHDRTLEASVGPWGSIARYVARAGERELRVLTIPLVEVSLLRVRMEPDERKVALGLLPWLPLIYLEKTPWSYRSGIGPFSLLLDARSGPDRHSLALTPLARYENRGSFRRLRLFFVDVYRQDPLD
ncbi:MAG: hypothetical protein AB1486_24600 [Planctomycetota bacterium]